MNGKLEGRTALVTGSSRGVGRLIATALASLGCKTVYCHGRTEEACAETAREVEKAGAKAVIVAAELSKPDEVDRLASRLLAEGGVDILYNNAAVMHPWRESVADITAEDWAWSFQVNVFAPARLTAALLPAMLERNWGRIVNLTSGIDKTPQLACYGASKWALDKWTDDLAFSLAGKNIIVSTLDPGWLKTDLGGPNADNEPTTVLPGALVPVLLPDGSAGGQFFRAQEHRDFQI